MHVLVLGAGVIGVATAYELAADGHAVTVIDRQPGPGLETSFANGGQISASHATPWAKPSAPWQALRWLGRSDAPLLYHLRWDPALWGWTARFLRNCTRPRMLRNIERSLRVALYSRDRLRALRQATAIAYRERSCGILHIFRDRREFDRAARQVDPMNRFGCALQAVDPAECVRLEPALAAHRERLVGGIYSPDDETGDAHLFTGRLAALCERRGVAFRWGESASRIAAADGGVAGVETSAGFCPGDACVVALGSFAPALLKPLGLRLPVCPAKGYSVTIEVGESDRAPAIGLIDDEVKMVYSRLDGRLRAAGTAEFTGYDNRVSEVRARSLLDRVMELLPGCGNAEGAMFWAGLRPSTPDGVPVIGATPVRGLFLNCGHGTLGWTMACGSARITADLVFGRRPEVAVDGLGLDRFG